MKLSFYTYYKLHTGRVILSGHVRNFVVINNRTDKLLHYLGPATRECCVTILKKRGCDRRRGHKKLKTQKNKKVIRVYATIVTRHTKKKKSTRNDFLRARVSTVNLIRRKITRVLARSTLSSSTIEYIECDE